MRDILEQLLRAAGLPNPERAEQLWTEYRADGPNANNAFAALMAWYGGGIYRRIWGFVRSDAADDLFQEALVKLHRERAKLATFADALRWLRTVAATECVDAHRRNKRRKAREQARAVSTESSTLPDGQWELQESLRVGLASLSAREREAVSLVYFEGLTRQDAATALGVHRDTFAKLLDGALARLRGSLATVAVIGTAATTTTIEAALATRIPTLLSSRLSKFVSAVLETTPAVLHPRAGMWLPGKTQLLVAVVIGGSVSVSLALFLRSPEMKTASPPPTCARLGVERLETRENPAGGILDSTFGTNGVALVPVDTNSQQTVAVQTDGKILTTQRVTAGNSYQPAVTRLNSNGSVDNTFGTNGTFKLPLIANTVAVTRDSVVNALTVAPDGKILVGFSAYTKTNLSGSSDGEYAVARLNANGTLDTTFGNNHGYWLYNPTAKDEFVNQLTTVPTAGGGYSVIIGGTAVQANGAVAFAAAKLTQAGQLDPTFGTGGVTVRTVSTGLAPGTPSTSMAVTTSGEVVFAGLVGKPGADLYGRVLVGFTPAGQIDAGFGTGGVVILRTVDAAGAQTTTFPGTIYGMSESVVTAQGNNLIVVGSVIVNGTPGNGGVGAGYVIRYTLAGALDPTFGTGGVYYGPASLTTGNSVFSKVVVETDGSIALTGKSENNPSGNLLVGHLTANGQADPTFGTAGTGLVIQQNPYSTSSNPTLNVDPNGNLLVGYVTALINPARVFLMRFTGS